MFRSYPSIFIPRQAAQTNVANRLKAIRASEGLTQVALARYLDVTAKTVMDIEAGRRNAGPKLADRIWQLRIYFEFQHWLFQHFEGRYLADGYKGLRALGLTEFEAMLLSTTKELYEQYISESRVATVAELEDAEKNFISEGAKPFDGIEPEECGSDEPADPESE